MTKIKVEYVSDYNKKDEVIDVASLTGNWKLNYILRPKVLQSNLER